MPVFSLDLTWEFLSRVILASVLSSNVTCFACFVLSFAPVSVSSVLLPEIPSESFWAQGMTIGAVCVDRFSVSSLSKFSLRLTEVPKMSMLLVSVHLSLSLKGHIWFCNVVSRDFEELVVVLFKFG